jgi:glucose-6-phosphate 1-epimerase
MSISDAGLGNKAAAAGRVSFLDGQGEMPMLEVSTAWSTAEIYLHGAHVTRFTKKDEAPLLFISQCSRYANGQPIRGGIPVIFPWFGHREGLPQHGFARLNAWELKEFTPAADGSVSLRLRLPEYPEASGFPPFTADYIVTVKDALTVQLVVKNNSLDDELAFENCLHCYFEVGDISAVAIRGLKGASYLDKVADFAHKTETEEAIRVGSEVDRIYLNTTATVDIEDRRLNRRIRIEKEGSASTVVWNQWIGKAQQMPDFGNDEYTRMVCVEPGNVASNRLQLAPGATSTLVVKVSSSPLS